MPWPAGGWIVEVGLAPELIVQAWRWSPEKRRVFQELAAVAAYKAVDAIKVGQLHKQRDAIWIGKSSIVCFLRRHPRHRRTVLVTLSHFHYHGPNGPFPPGARAPMPLYLVLNVTTNGTHYSIDLIKGVLPRPPDEGQVLTSIDKAKSKRSKLNLLDLLPWRRKPDILRPEASPEPPMRKGAITYVPRQYLSHRAARASGAIPSLAPASVEEIVGTGRWMSKLSAMLGLGRKPANGSGAAAPQARQPHMSEFICSENNIRNSIGSAEAHYSYRMISRRRIHMANLPVRPGGTG